MKKYTMHLVGPIDDVIHVHRPGCGDLRHRAYRDQDAWTIKAATFEDLVTVTYGEHMAATGLAPEDYSADFRVFPCAGIQVVLPEMKTASMSPLERALEIRRINDRILPPELKEETVRLTDEELDDRMLSLVREHGINRPMDAYYTLYWGGDGPRVALSVQRAKASWDRVVPALLEALLAEHTGTKSRATSRG